jgi:hypothetical protein
MDFANTNFVIGQVAGSSPNGAMEMSSFAMHNSNINNSNSEFLDAEEYNKYKNEEKNYIFYKKINFEFKKSFKVKLTTVSLHLGDVIDFITRHTGIKKLIMWATNGNCGCEARRVKFNEWFKIPLIFFKLDSFNYADYIVQQQALEQKIKNNVYGGPSGSYNALDVTNRAQDNVYLTQTDVSTIKAASYYGIPSIPTRNNILLMFKDLPNLKLVNEQNFNSIYQQQLEQENIDILLFKSGLYKWLVYMIQYQQEYGQGFKINVRTLSQTAHIINHTFL